MLLVNRKLYDYRFCAVRKNKTIKFCAGVVLLGSIVVSIPACHAGDRGSIPRRGGLFLRARPTRAGFGLGIGLGLVRVRISVRSDANLPYKIWCF